MAQLLVSPKIRFFDTNGKPLVGGKLYSYAAGTSTLLATFTDQTETGTNANPVILDANGEASVWLSANSYKLVLKDSSDNVQWTVDKIQSINDSSITTIKINDLAVTTAKINDLAVTTAKINDLAVTAAKVADGAISSSSKFTAGVVDTNALAAGAVTQAKRAALGQQLSANSGSFSTTSSTAVDITNLSCTITTTGRPVRIQLIGEVGQIGEVGTSTNNVSPATGSAGYIGFLRGATSLGELTVSSLVASNGSGPVQSTVPVSAFSTIDTPAAGTYTYKAQARAVTSGQIVTVSYAKLHVYEL